MDNIWILIVTSLLSGLIATVITLICQKNLEKKREKEEIFKILMSHRYLISDKDNVEAINRVEVVFYKNQKVVESLKSFMDAADEAMTNSSKLTLIDDRYLKLLEEMSKCLGKKDIDWEKIKRFYYPQGLASKIIEEAALRKAQITQANGVAQQQLKGSQISNTELGLRLVTKAMESPNGLEMLTKLAEIADKTNKK